MPRIALAILALIAIPVSVAAEPFVDDAKIKDLLVGKSAVFVDGSIATYNVDGSYNFVAANNRYYSGKYTVTNGKVCFALDTGERRCDAVGADAQSAFLQNPTGTTLRMSLNAPITLQNVTKLCGVPMAYNTYPPAAYIPAETAAFLGTWVGRWDYGMCGALIIESIKSNGVATAIYVNGEFGLEHPHKAGAMRFLALISGSILSDGGRTLSFEAVMTGKDTLSVRRIGGPGAGTAQLTRR